PLVPTSFGSVADQSTGSWMWRCRRAGLPKSNGRSVHQPLRPSAPVDRRLGSRAEAPFGTLPTSCQSLKPRWMGSEAAQPCARPSRTMVTDVPSRAAVGHSQACRLRATLESGNDGPGLLDSVVWVGDDLP